jgi:hypothetical protein
MVWTRPRIALVACAAAQALAMLYVGLFQIGYVARLACPLFGAGCQSVALAPLAWPLGFSDGLLAVALAGVICAVAQVRGARSPLIGLAFLDLLAYVLLFAAMGRFHAWDFWHVSAGLLAVPVAALAVVPDDTAQQQN